MANFFDQYIPLSVISAIALFFAKNYTDQRKEEKKKREETQDKIEYLIRVLQRVKKQTEDFIKSSRIFIDESKKNFGAVHTLRVVVMADFDRALDTLGKEDVFTAFNRYYKESDFEVVRSFQNIVQIVDYLNSQILHAREHNSEMKNIVNGLYKKAESQVSRFDTELLYFLKEPGLYKLPETEQNLKFRNSLFEIYASYSKSAQAIDTSVSEAIFIHAFDHFARPINTRLNEALNNDRSLFLNEQVKLLTNDSKSIIEIGQSVKQHNMMLVKNIEGFNSAIIRQLKRLDEELKRMSSYHAPEDTSDLSFLPVLIVAIAIAISSFFFCIHNKL